MDEFYQIRKDLEDLGLQIVKIYWQRGRFDRTMQFEFVDALTEEELEKFENYVKGITTVEKL